jgi:hypothetical protein
MAYRGRASEATGRRRRRGIWEWPADAVRHEPHRARFKPINSELSAVQRKARPRRKEYAMAFLPRF